jgi:hypothetical protein
MGAAILFVCFLVGWVILAAYTAAYASHCYLVVVQASAAGLDRVDWPDEPMFDWLPGALYLGGLLVLVLAPAGLLARALPPEVLPYPRVLRFLLLGVPMLWLLFPVELLSSLTASSRWVLLSPRVLGGLLRLFPSVLLFYLATGLLFALAGGLVFLGLFTRAWYALPLAALGGSAVLLIHARLVGRLAWLLGERENRPEAVRKKKKTRESARPKVSRHQRASTVHDPWAVPPQVEEEETAPAAPGYRVVEQEEEKPPRPSYLDPEPEPYTVAAGEPEGLVPAAQRLELDNARVEREVQLRRRELPDPPPAFPLFSGVYTFPGYPSTQKAWLWLTCGGLATGGAMRMVALFWRG